MRGLCVGFTGGRFAPPAGQTGGAAAPPDPLGASHPALANPAQANRAPGFAVPASAARPHSAAFGGARGFSSYPVECAFRLPVRSRSSGAGERGAGGSEASPAHRRESEANLKVERFGEKAEELFRKISRPEHRNVLKKHFGAENTNAPQGSTRNSAARSLFISSIGSGSRRTRLRGAAQSLPLHR